MIKKTKEIKKPSSIGKLLDEKISKWIDPPFSIEVSYAKLTPDKIFREPVFIRTRPDLNADN